MQQLISMAQDQNMTSKELVEVINTIRKEEGNDVEIQHDKLMRRIRSFDQILANADCGESEYVDSRGKTQPMLLLSKRASMLAVSSESPKVNLAIIDRWQELEQQNSFNIPTTFAGALALAAKMAEENEKLGVTVKGQTVTIHRQAGTIHQQAEVIDHKRIVTDESESYLSVARVRSMNPNQRYSGALLGRISDKLNIPVIPQHAAKGQIPINTYHKSVWELAYPEASLFD